MVSAIKTLTSDVETLKQQLEFQLASMSAGLDTQKKKLDEKGHDMREVRIIPRDAPSKRSSVYVVFP